MMDRGGVPSGGGGRSKGTMRSLGVEVQSRGEFQVLPQKIFNKVYHSGRTFLFVLHYSIYPDIISAGAPFLIGELRRKLGL